MDQQTPNAVADNRPRHIVVIGTSAGGVEALKTLVATLPPDLPAAIFIVVHLPAHGHSYLPEILSRCGLLRASTPADGESIEVGRIYVATPDHHLLIANDHIHLTRGPKEGRFRPSINVTFRSAAMSYGESVIGVILTGMLDDGTAGLWEVKARGGITVVQNPENAAFPSMPMSALEGVQVDFKADLDQIGALLTDLVRNELEVEQSLSENNGLNPSFSGLTCPDCRGPIWQTRSHPVEFRCRVGHVYSGNMMIEEYSSMQERKLYEAILSLEEGAEISEFMAARVAGDDRAKLMQEAEQIRAQAETIKRLIAERKGAPVV